MLHPLISDLVKGDGENQLVQDVPESDITDYSSLLFECYDKSAVVHLGGSSEYWETVLSALRLRCSIDLG